MIIYEIQVNPHYADSHSCKVYSKELMLSYVNCAMSAEDVREIIVINALTGEVVFHWSKWKNIIWFN